jgi:hypothetical protein
MRLLFASTNPPVPPGGFSVGSANLPRRFRTAASRSAVCYHREIPGDAWEEGRGQLGYDGEGVLPKDKAGRYENGNED